MSVLAAAPASATEVVDDDRAQCPTARHTSVQAGVGAASAGELVQVCDGVYPEAVTIQGAGKDGVRLRAKAVHGATLQAPDNYDGAIVTVADAERVEVARFRIVGPFTGPGGQGCPPGQGTVKQGVQVTGDFRSPAGIQVRDNVIQQITPPIGESCDFFVGNGVEVNVGAAARVAYNTIEDYASAGVVVANGASGLVDHNRIRRGGVGANFFHETKVDLNTNEISENSSQGVLFENFFGDHSSQVVRIANNRIFGNRQGISFNDQMNARISYNRVFANREEGIVVSTQSGIGNLLDHNDARGNGGTDCSDASTDTEYSGPPGYPFFGTSNRWAGNRGNEATPPGICKP